MLDLKHVTILGAGLTGLTTAYRLSQILPSTSRISLIDSADRVGGWVKSNRRFIGFKDEHGKVIEGEVVLESGPRSIRPRGSKGAPGMMRLIKDLGLESEMIPVSTSHPSAKNRFLLDTSSSKLIKLPSSPLTFLARQPPLLKGLLPSMLSEPFKSTPTRLEEERDESVDSFMKRRFGDNVANNLMSAMIHGIYATDSRQLSVRSTFGQLWDSEEKYGSVVLGMLRGTKKAEKMDEDRQWNELGELGKKRKEWSLYGLKGGLEALTKRMTMKIEGDSRIEMKMDEEVKGVRIRGSGIEVHTSRGIVQTDHIISALPPITLHSLIPFPQLLANPYTSVGVINLVYPLPSSSIHPAGFGYLVPRSTFVQNPEGVLGVIFDSTAVPGIEASPHSIEGKVTKLTVMMGGPYWSYYRQQQPQDRDKDRVTGNETEIPDIPSSSEELITLALKHIHKTLPILRNVEPIISVAKIQKDCIPTYLPGHGSRLKDLNTLLGPFDPSRSSEGSDLDHWRGKLSLVGNGYGGVGVNDCVYSVDQVMERLKRGEKPTGLERWADWR